VKRLGAEVVGNFAEGKNIRQEKVEEMTWRHGTYPLVDFAGNTVGSIVLSLDETAAVAAAGRTRLVTLAGSLLGLLLLGLVLRLALGKLVLEPVNNVAHTMEKVAEGDFEARCSVMADDEMGFVAGQINATLDQVLVLIQSDEERMALQRDIQDLLVVVSDIADGDLTREAKVSENIIGNVADAVNMMIENIAELIEQIGESSLKVSSAANQIQAGSEQLSAGAQHQMEDITNTTSAVQEMAINIEQVANNAEATTEAAARSRQSADEGQRRVQEVIGGMENIRASVIATLRQIKRLGDRSMEISTIVETISKIAAQTDMLALNAAIEAARAGEHGRGFSVVAEEVRRLAERSADAAREIEELVSAIQTETGESVRAMDEVTENVEHQVEVVHEAGQSLDRIAEMSAKAADLVQEITLASKQQVRGAEEVVKAMGTVSEVSKQASVGVDQTLRTTGALVKLSEDLMKAISEFKVRK